MLIVLAIAALIATCGAATSRSAGSGTSSTPPCGVVVDAFNWVVDAAKAVFEWIADHWPLLLAILTGPDRRGGRC